VAVSTSLSFLPQPFTCTSYFLRMNKSTSPIPCNPMYARKCVQTRPTLGSGPGGGGSEFLGCFPSKPAQCLMPHPISGGQTTRKFQASRAHGLCAIRHYNSSSSFLPSAAALTPLGRHTAPCCAAHWKSRSPLTSPSFLPVGASSSMPTHHPAGSTWAVACVCAGRVG
jgi:hypothetical protein